jgi:hypothetical protein
VFREQLAGDWKSPARIPDQCPVQTYFGIAAASAATGHPDIFLSMQQDLALLHFVAQQPDSADTAAAASMVSIRFFII